MTFTHDGKLIHSVAFTVLAASAILGWREHKAKLIVLLTFLGMAIEVVQGAQLIGRGPDVFDWVADCVGMACGITIASWTKWHWITNPPKRPDEYPDREIDCQEAMEAGFRAIVDCMLEAGWTRGEIMRSLRRLVAADNMTQRENAKVEAKLAIARAMVSASRPRQGHGPTSGVST
ncbi:hypothetical protein [Mesorhizobium sp.]|uniref:hypothetical protein n=1 Tax=Mesorhizobium sp. TaxID=1871066 RepID=UPI0025F4AD0E|nr:hypothetical protein [Mesorhizobium sp.]